MSFRKQLRLIPYIALIWTMAFAAQLFVLADKAFRKVTR